MPINKAHIYKALVEELDKKCKELQLQNEQYVRRINKIKKMKRRRQLDVDIIKARLSKHKDNWRTISIKRQMAPHPKRKIEQKRGPKPKIKPSSDIHGQTIETQKNVQQQQQVQHLQFHHLQHPTGNIIDTDWSGLSETGPFQLE